ncbi:hypothetical protein MSG28_008450 [Choristoneura fumiferana]|uniref:Uncharacterized protein n=1 Tax=Choristoneura fumiferana TaxID=7141 RepID=A0ACC0J5V2_CHOFU|nr:hypothetical protein MSG28_008450 [Choristoneura fumiferana]
MIAGKKLTNGGLTTSGFLRVGYANPYGASRNCPAEGAPEVDSAPPVDLPRTRDGEIDYDAYWDRIPEAVQLKPRFHYGTRCCPTVACDIHGLRDLSLVDALRAKSQRLLRECWAICLRDMSPSENDALNNEPFSKGRQRIPLVLLVLWAAVIASH